MEKVLHMINTILPTLRRVFKYCLEQEGLLFNKEALMTKNVIDVQPHSNIECTETRRFMLIQKPIQILKS